MARCNSSNDLYEFEFEVELFAGERVVGIDGHVRIVHLHDRGGDLMTFVGLQLQLLPHLWVDSVRDVGSLKLGHHFLAAVQSPKNAEGLVDHQRKVLIFVRCNLQLVTEPPKKKGE